MCGALIDLSVRMHGDVLKADGPDVKFVGE
jgi:hypothetical protein